MSWNYYPALLHRPSVRLIQQATAAALMRQGASKDADANKPVSAKGRVSTPFFLRPRSDALLSAVMLQSKVLQAAGSTQYAILPPEG
jgi:hypothetical protein